MGAFGLLVSLGLSAFACMPLSLPLKLGLNFNITMLG